VHGCDDITALRLLVNDLYDEIHSTFRTVERNLISAGVTPTKEADARRAKVQEGLHELAQASDAVFIVCYHVRGTARWDMAWSRGLTRDNAVQAMCRLFKGHLENPLELFVGWSGSGGLRLRPGGRLYPAGPCATPGLKCRAGARASALSTPLRY
jgi:hypothetical protein